MSNTTASRTNILARLREPQRPECGFDERDYLSRFDWDRAERVRRFTERMVAVRAEVHQATADTWLDVVKQVCAAKGLKNLLVSPETERGKQIHAQAEHFPALKTYDRPIEGWKEELFYGVDAAFTSTFGGIAETGTLILMPDAEEPRLMSLVPPVHIAVLEVDKLYTTFAEAVQEQGWVKTGMPSNALLVSGPSKSADIEQTLAYGVHGPKELVVILV
ncbi:LutC/YkgG family protein [Thiothrix lacustris]|uniref:LutC/YkgG family protein n=1 Tax=Thiothrix lacustris TaxID=525917 RepID=UPI0005717940|nr:lactate utilization protein [Thiothrix lacustris]